MKKSSNTYECVSCLVDLNLDHTGIQCRQGHHLCPNCSGTWIDTLFSSNFANDFPPKCCICKIAINVQVFERNIRMESQRNKFLAISLDHFLVLDENEMWVDCPSCDYKEIRLTSSEPNTIYCQNELCKRTSCYYCYKEVTNSHLISISQALDNSSDNDSSDDDDLNDDIDQHIGCWKYGPQKIIIEKLIEEGSSQECPNCHLRGQKDDGCLHMLCPECNQSWCYFCGKKEEDTNRRNNGNIYRHNDNWSQNPLRCPMYFNQIGDIDENWYGKDDVECLTKFHRLKTLKLLKEYYDKIGEKEFSKIVGTFPQSLGGFTLDEIEGVDPEQPFFVRI